MVTASSGYSLQLNFNPVVPSNITDYTCRASIDVIGVVSLNGELSRDLMINSQLCVTLRHVLCSCIHQCFPVQVIPVFQNLFCIYIPPAPSGAPEMFEAVAGQRQVVFSWSPPPVTQQNRLITSYTLSCSPSPSSLPQSPSQTRPLTVAGFSPDTSYSCSVVANSGLASGPPAHTNFTTLRDCESYSMINGAEVYGMCVDILYRFIFPNTSWWSGCLL